jgi:hypothetical protein
MTVEQLKKGNELSEKIEAINKVAIVDSNGLFRFVENPHPTDIERVAKLFAADFLAMLLSNRTKLQREFGKL